MPIYPYLVYDVFTDSPFGGNQLAVFTDAATIPEEKLQMIAREFNFSEVTFIYPPKDRANTARVRIFTPNTEIDFAGHPIIGTLYALSELGLSSPMTLELRVGPIAASIDAHGAAFTAAQALTRIAEPEAALVAACLGLPETAVNTETHAPVQASLGLPFVLCELVDHDVLAQCSPNVEMITKAAAQYPAGGDFAIFAYVRDGNAITSRMFAPLDDIAEDPATGSASATLAALLTEISGQPQSLRFQQGAFIGRPSNINVMTKQNPLRVTVSGQAVKVMSGNVFAIMP